MHFLEKNWCGKKRMHDFLRKVEPKTPMLWLLLVTLLFLCVDSQGHTASPLSIHQTVKQVGNEFFLERTQGRQEKNSVFVIPLSYRIPRGREDIMRNILSSESRRRQLLGREREPLSRQLEQAVLMQRDSPLGLARRKNSMGVGRYFEQVVLGNVVNMAEYYVSLQVNGESYYVQLDTGSSNLLISTANCSHCQAKKRLQFDGLKNISCSSSNCCQHSSSCCSQQDPSLCGVKVEYGSGFASGVLVQGTVTISNISVDTIFGGILDSSPNFEPTSVSGILGMASSQLACNPTCVTPLFDAIVQEKQIANVFSVLLNPNDGVLVLGGVDGNFTNGSISYTDMPSSDFGYYEVTVNTVSVDGTAVYSNSFTSVVDTGTTLVYLPETCYKDIVKYFQSHHSNPFWNSSGEALVGSLSSSYISSLPSVDIQVSGNVNISIPPHSYMVSVGDGNYMFGIQSSGGSSSILGDVLLQNYYTVFDRVNARIGFGPAVSVKSVNLSNVPGAGNITITSPSTSSLTLPIFGIVLIVVGGVFGVALFTMAVCLLVRRHRKTTVPSANVWPSQAVYGTSYYYYR
jgi:hypothetical protein